MFKPFGFDVAPPNRIGSLDTVLICVWNLAAADSIQIGLGSESCGGSRGGFQFTQQDQSLGETQAENEEEDDGQEDGGPAGPYQR